MARKPKPRQRIAGSHPYYNIYFENPDITDLRPGMCGFGQVSGQPWGDLITEIDLAGGKVLVCRYGDEAPDTYKWLPIAAIKKAWVPLTVEETRARAAAAADLLGDQL